MRQVVRKLLQAPLSTLKYFWETIWSAFGFITGVIGWLFLGRPVPSFDWIALDWLRPEDLSWIAPYLECGIALVIAAFVVLKISKWWIHRPPRLKYVDKERIVCKEKAASQPSDPTEKMVTKYEGTQKRAERLPLDDVVRWWYHRSRIPRSQSRWRRRRRSFGPVPW